MRGLVDTAHPLLVQIIPIRRCNIDCGYCNEYDKVSPPVPTDVMMRRIDKLAELGTSVVAFSGGEPMLHPGPRRADSPHPRRGMMAGLITNGYFLVPKRIEALNDAGLDFLQISIDNVEPDEVSKKSLRVLDKKLQDLKDHATFDVNINSVLGGGIKNAEDARTINNRARELGFSTSIGIIHDGSGRLKPLGPAERKVYDEVSAAISGPWQVFKNLYSGITSFQDNLADGKAQRVALPRGRALPLHLRRRGSSTTARSSAALRACRSRAIRSTTSAANSTRPSRARRTARSAACTASRRWTSGEAARSPVASPQSPSLQSSVCRNDSLRKD